MAKGSEKKGAGRKTGGATKKRLEEVTRDYTIHVGKLIHKIQFKKRAPRTIREIKLFAQKAMGTEDVRIDGKLNKFIWSRGIRAVPRRVRVRISRLRNKSEDAEKKMYSLVQYIPVESFHNLNTEIVEAAD